MNDHDPLLVVGGGASAHACIERYRDAGGPAPVVLLSADDRLPYFRPHLSKGVIRGEVDLGDVALEADGWYAQHDVDARLGTTVTGLDPTTSTVTTSAGIQRYGELVLATGSRSKVPPILGADHPDVVTLRSAADAGRLLDVLANAGRVAVVGSGFIGCEIAASMRARGTEVAMVTSERLPQQDRLGDGVGRLLDGWLRDLGVEIHAGSAAAELAVAGGGARVELTGGPPVEADAVLLATGAAPNVGLWPGGDGPIEVDARMHTARPGVWAIGDIAAAWHPVAERRLTVEHWGDALAMGAVAGANLAGHDAEWTDVPGFWSDVGGQTIKYVAWGDGWDRWHERPSAGGTTFWFEREHRLVGVLTYEHDDDIDAAPGLVADGVPIDQVL